MYVHIPDGDVENVGADGGGDGHVAFALFGHQNTGNEIGHGGTGRQEGKSHHLKSISVPYQVKMFFFVKLRWVCQGK